MMNIQRMEILKMTLQREGPLPHDLRFGMSCVFDGMDQVCGAGLTIALFNSREALNWNPTSSQAAWLLGITDEQRTHLFFNSGPQEWTPKDYSHITREDIAEEIDKMIKEEILRRGPSGTTCTL